MFAGVPMIAHSGRSRTAIRQQEYAKHNDPTKLLTAKLASVIAELGQLRSMAMDCMSQ